MKSKDYELAGQVEAENEYDAWRILRGTETPLGVGDVLESEGGELRICKYVGFEAAQWILPETKAGGEPAPPGASGAGPVLSAG